MAECKSCGADIQWGLTQARGHSPGKRIPVDPRPDDQRGNLIRFTDDEGNVRFYHVTAEQDIPMEKRNPDRWVSHFATCPAAADFRKPTRDHRG